MVTGNRPIFVLDNNYEFLTLLIQNYGDRIISCKSIDLIESTTPSLVIINIKQYVDDYLELWAKRYSCPHLLEIPIITLFAPDELRLHENNCQHILWPIDNNVLKEMIENLSMVETCTM